MGLIDRIRAWFSSEDEHSIDTYWLRTNSDFEWTHINIPLHGPARCNICGKQFPVSKMPKVISHVAEHDGQGAAEIDPTQTTPLLFQGARSFEEVPEDEVEDYVDKT